MVPVGCPPQSFLVFVRVLPCVIGMVVGVCYVTGKFPSVLTYKWQAWGVGNGFSSFYY